MVRVVPYHVRMVTATAADAGAVTDTSKAYFAGDGAVIWCCADERPAGSTSSAGCGRSATPAMRALFVG
jgi:hypothetical protein